MAKICILNGAGKKNGNTAAIVDAFREGAQYAGNELTGFMPCSEIEDSMLLKRILYF